MKKIISIVLVLILAVSFTACGQSNNKDKVIKVGASPVPHTEILEQCRSYIESKGYKLEIVEFTDYVLPNQSTYNGETDANYFQHIPYLDHFNDSHDMNLVNVLKVHFEPLGIYQGGKGTTIDELKEGDKIAVPDDATNCARALQLLAKNNIISITNDLGLKTTIKDIDSNGYEIIALEAGNIAVQLPELTFAVINGNYAVDFKLIDKIVAQEDSSSIAAGTFANIIAVKPENKDTEKIKVLCEALQQDSVKEYIKNSYEGRVLPYEE